MKKSGLAQTELSSLKDQSHLENKINSDGSLMANEPDHSPLKPTVAPMVEITDCKTHRFSETSTTGFLFTRTKKNSFTFQALNNPPMKTSRAVKRSPHQRS